MKIKLQNYINDELQTEEDFLFYDKVYSDFENELLDSAIVNVDMLHIYLQYYYSAKWFFAPNYISVSQNVEINADTIVSEYVLNQGMPVFEEDVIEAINYLPKNVVSHSFNRNSDILVSSGRNQRFHINIFVITQNELDMVSDIIANAIYKYDFIGFEELMEDIRNSVPSIINNNSNISDSGIRKVMAVKLGSKYSFNNAVISSIGRNLTAKDVLLAFAKNHDDYSIDEVDSLASSLGTVLNYHLDKMLEYSIRVSGTRFVSRNKVIFDVQQIDKALSNYCVEPDNFAPLSSIDNFASFPPVSNFPWNQRLLESFLLTTSNAYTLLRSDSLNKNNICGVVASSSYKEFDSNAFLVVATKAVAKSGIELNNKVVLDFLANEGYIVQRRFAGIDEVISGAKKDRMIINA